LLEVAIFDLLHEGFALENVALQSGGELAGHHEKLIVRDFRERDGAARGNEMRAPLEHEARVPEDKKGENGRHDGESGPARTEKLSEAI